MNISLKLRPTAFDFKVGGSAYQTLCNSIEKFNALKKGQSGVLSGELVFCSMGLTAPNGFSSVFRLQAGRGFGSKTKSSLGVWIANEVKDGLRVDSRLYAQSECALNFGLKRSEKTLQVVFGSPGRDGVYLNILTFKAGELIEAEDRLLPDLKTDSQLSMECRMVIDGLEQKAPGSVIYWLEPFPAFKDPRVKWVKVEEYLKEGQLTRILPDSAKGVLERFKLSIALVVASVATSVLMVSIPLAEYSKKRQEALDLHSTISQKLPTGRSLQEMAGWANLKEVSAKRVSSYELAAQLVSQIPSNVKIREVRIDFGTDASNLKPSVELNLAVPLVRDETGLQEAQKVLLAIQRDSGVNFKVLSGVQGEQSGQRYFEFVAQGELL